MAPASIQMVVLEGECGDGATVEEDEFDVTTDEDAATATAPDRVVAAILGTREGAADAGLELSSIGVTWTDQVEAAALRDALAAHKIENVMLVSAFLAAAALAQNVGGAIGYDRTAVLFVEPDTATLAVVETSDGSITDVYQRPIYAESYDEATAQLTGLVARLGELPSAPDGLFLVGSGVDIAPIKPALESATALDVSAPEDPETALARGAALASANAPLFASSTVALAYAQDPGTGGLDGYVLPEYLSVSTGSDDELAYSAVPDEDASAPTVLIEKLFAPREPEPRRRPVLLVGSGLAVVGISAVLALEIALAVGIRTTGTVALRPAPAQSLIVPTQQAPAPAPVQASAPMAKINVPAPVAAPRPISPLLAAPMPAPVPAAPPIPAPPPAAAPIVPVPIVVPAPPVAPLLPRVPVPNAVVSPPAIQAPRLLPPQAVLPKAPTLPEPVLPKAPTLPEPVLPKAPTLPQPVLPKAPTLPQPVLPKAPTLPEPVLPKAPTLPQPMLPKAPTLPQPALPQAPALPEPVLPKAPTLPSFGGPFPQSPPMPSIPSGGGPFGGGHGGPFGGGPIGGGGLFGGGGGPFGGGHGFGGGGGPFGGGGGFGGGHGFGGGGGFGGFGGFGGGHH